MAQGNEEENKQNEAMKMRAFLETHRTFGVSLLSALAERHARFRLEVKRREVPGGCRLGASYGDFESSTGQL
jgi:hypothetical protein